MNEPIKPSLSQIDSAIAKYQQLVAANPQQAEFRANLGSCYAQQQQWQKAIACYEEAISIDPDLAGVYRNLAKIYSKIDNEFKAADYLFQGLKVDPLWANASEYCRLGNLLQSQHKLEEAEFCYRQAIELKPDYPPAYNSLAELLTAKDENYLAIAIYQQGIKYNPQSVLLHFGLGQTLATLKKWQEAKDCYERALELEPKLALGHYQRAIALFRLNCSREARQSCQQAIRLKPDFWEAYYQLGMIFQNEQQWSEATAAYQNVRGINPQFAPALIRLALIYRSLTQYQQASECYEKLLDLVTPDSALEAEVWEGYAAALKKHPQPQARHYYKLGRMFRAKSSFEEAIAAYQKAIELEPNFELAYIDLQYTKTSPEMLDKAISFYRRLTEQHPQISLAWGNLGDALTEKKQIAEAIDCYRKSCYARTIAIYPQLAALDWQPKKQSAPDFIIIGAEKCGTSSLHNYLSHHPQVLLAHKKEINFFKKYFNCGMDWYLAQFPTITDTKDFITGESTPNYLRFPQVARRIKELCPKTKLILLLRNPTDRAISWHYHKVNTGLAAGTFIDAMQQEMATLATFSEEDLIKTSYSKPDNILSSLYIYKIKAWLELFDRESFLIIKSEELYANPQRVMSLACNFLGLAEYQLEKYPKVNAGSYSKVDCETRAKLAEYFKPYNKKLENFLNIKFNWN